MNKVILMGRLVKDPEIRYTQGDSATCIAKYTLAVDRKFKRQNDEQTADFISCIAFGKSGEFVEKYCQKGTKLAITGRVQTGSYTNKDGQKVYTTDVIAEEQEFAESKNAQNASQNARNTGSGTNTQTRPQNASQRTLGDKNDSSVGLPSSAEGFMNIPDDLDTELPFL